MFSVGNINFRFISIGYECSTASALRGLGLRQFALPFDWIQSSANAMELCFKEDFKRFHTNLRFNHNRTRLIDDYGFEFPHDYPLVTSENTDSSGYAENIIADNWAIYYDEVKAKYDRRIERFRTIMKDTAPVIVLCRYAISNLFYIQQFFKDYYKKDNLYFVNASPEKFENQTILNIHTEKNGIWSEAEIWRQGINIMVPKLLQSRHRFSLKMDSI